MLPLLPPVLTLSLPFSTVFSVPFFSCLLYTSFILPFSHLAFRLSYFFTPSSYIFLLYPIFSSSCLSLPLLLLVVGANQTIYSTSDDCRAQQGSGGPKEA